MWSEIVSDIYDIVVIEVGPLLNSRTTVYCYRRWALSRQVESRTDLLIWVVMP